LRGVTIDIYDNARDQTVIDSSVCRSSPLTIRVCNITNTIATDKCLFELLKQSSGQCWEIDTYGTTRKQGCHSQACWNHHRCYSCPLLDRRLGLWRLQGCLRVLPYDVRNVITIAPITPGRQGRSVACPLEVGRLSAQIHMEGGLGLDQPHNPSWFHAWKTVFRIAETGRNRLQIGNESTT
jgi:hypothetical protein